MKGKPLESKGLKIRPKPAPAGTVRMPRQFVADFQSVALHEGWDADYLADMKQWVRDNPPGMDYIATLALAYRNWYRPGPANGYVRVYAWLGQVGLAPVTIYTRENNNETASTKLTGHGHPAGAARKPAADAQRGRRRPR